MSNPIAGQMVMFAAIFAIFYFVLIRPQQQQRKKHERAILGAKKGDEITTAGGIVGEVIFVKTMAADGASTLEDRITIKSGESRLIVERSKIVRITGIDAGKATTTDVSSAATKT